MDRMRSTQAGFTLLELSVVTVIFGLILAFSVPVFRSYGQAQQLKGAAENLVSQLRLSRQKAMSIGHPQRVTFTTGTNGSYVVQDLTTTEDYGPFTPPKGVVIESANLLVGGTTGSVVTALTDGRFSGSGEIVFRDMMDRRDTVLVQTSGILSH